jgi:hypothetical protein
MGQVGSNQYQFKIIDLVDMIPYNPPGPLRIHDKIQLEFLVAMKGEVKFGFYPRENGKTITAGKRDDLPEDVMHHTKV